MSNMIRPPEHPKPSAAGLLAQNRLKNRLILGWHKKQNNNILDSLHENSIVKGYGENQFDREDNPDTFRNNVNQGSLWSEHESISMRNRNTLQDIHIRTAASIDGRTDLVSKRSLVVPGSESIVLNGQSSLLSHTAKDAKKINNQSTYVSHLKSHLNMSEVYQSKGWDEVANSIAYNETEFCYVTVDPNDHYKFIINDTIPTGLLTNDYLTLSRNGILQSTSDGNTELLTYPNLVRDHDIYHKLKRIPIFRQFRLWKPFGLWRRAVRSKKMKLMATQLNSTLCLLNEFYQRQIIVVTEQCNAMRLLAVMRLRDLSVYDMDAYVDTQALAQRQCKEKQLTMLCNLLAHLCREGEMHAYNALTKVPEAIAMLQFGTNSTVQPVTSPRGRQGKGAAASATTKPIKPVLGATTGKMNVNQKPLTDGLDTFSFATLDSVNDSNNKWSTAGGGVSARNVSYTERASIRINCRKLAAFLRLVDFAVRDALYECVETALTTLHRCLKGNALRKGEVPEATDGFLFHESQAKGLVKVSTKGRDATALFKVNVVLKTDGDTAEGLSPHTGETGGLSLLDSAARKYNISINPAKDTVIDKFRSVVTETMRVASYTEGAFFNSQCIEMLVPIANELSTLPLEDIIFQDKDNTVCRLMESCCAVVATDYDACQGHVLKYRYMCLQYEKNAKMFAQAETSKLFDMSPEQMIAELLEFETSLAACAEITDFQDLGVFRMEFPSFKKNISSMINNCKTQFYRLIPELYVANGDRFYAELSKLNDVLSTKPTTLEQFVKVVEVFNKATADSDRLQASFQYITAIRDILDTRGIPKTEAILRQNLTITTVWNNFSNFMSDFDEQLEEANALYLKEMKSRTKVLLEPLERAKAYLQSVEVNSPESDPDVILAELAVIKRSMETVRKRGAEIEAFQDILKFSVFNRAVVSNMMEEVNSDFLLWSVVKLIKELQVSFMSVNFLDAESDEVERQLRYAAVTISQKVQQTTNSKVLLWLTDALQELQIIAPIIKKLQSKTQRDIHTQRIQSILGRNIFDEQLDTTVGELVSLVDIKSHVAALDEVYEESLFQFNLECRVAELTKNCSSLEFVFGADRENKSLIFFSSLREFAVFFEDAIITLDACIASKFSAPHIDTFNSFRAKLQRCLEVNESLRIMQEGYLRIRVLFTSARTARYLSQSLKYFKILDEIWRSVMKLARFDPKVMQLYCSEKVRGDVAEALVAIAATDANTKTYVFDQCVRWPKLFLLDQSDLLEIFATQDPRKTFYKCRNLFANVTDIHFDESEPFNAVAVSSHEEILEFKKHCSARSNLVDWMKSIDTAMSDRIAEEIREYMFENRTLLDDLRVPKTVEQSRSCFVQIKFWWNVVDNLGKGTRHRMALRPQLQELSDQMVMYCSMMSNYSVKYQIKTMANMLVLLTSHRDLLQLLLADPDGEISETTFALEASLKKFYHIPSGTLTVKQGPFSAHYGMKYGGFCERLVVTPLTDKCFMALTTAMNDMTIPTVCGPHATGKSSTVAALARDLGLESMTFDCRNIRSPKIIFETMRAVLGVGLWMNFSHFDALNVQIKAVFLTILSSVQTAMHSRANTLYLGGDLIDVIHTSDSRPRICLLSNSKALSNDEPFHFSSVRLQFRPISFCGPSRIIILTIILSSYNFANVARIAPRLDALCEYVHRHKLVHERVLLRVMLDGIRIVGERNDHTPAALPMQAATIAKQLFLRMPSHLQEHVTEYDLRFICNLFLEVVFTGNNGGDHDTASFKNTPSPAVYADILLIHLMSSSSSSVIVVGPPAIGKSTLIKNTINKTVEDNNAEIEQAELKKYNKKNAIVPQRMEAHSRTLNPYVMADYQSDERNHFMQTISTVALDTAAERVIENFVSDVDPLGPQLLVHIDTQSSLQFAALISRATFVSERHSRQVKFVWECVDLMHVDPSVVFSVPIVFMKEKSYNMNDVIAAQAEQLSVSEAKVFRILLTSCIESYILPCLAQYPTDAYQSQTALVQNLFQMIGSILKVSGITSTTSGSKWSEDSVRRIVLCCCIWTVGVCSPTCKERFDGWFREYFDADAERTKDRQIYPNCVGRSVFENYLHQPDEGRVDLEWTTFHRKVHSTTTQLQNSSELSPETRQHHSHANLYYTTIFNGSEGLSTMIVPTATARAYSFIQSCLMESGGHVLIAGGKGAGKSSLLRELVEISKTVDSGNTASLNTASRWVCRTTDCGPKRLQEHIARCKSSLYPLFMERQLMDKGSVVVEDVSIKMHTDNHRSCAEFIRLLCENHEIYNITRSIWRSADRMYTLLSSDNSPGYLNERFIRHQMVLCCDPDELRAIFVQKLSSECPLLAEDFLEDIVKVTFVMMDSVRRGLFDLLTASAANSGSDYDKLSNHDQLYMLSCYNRSVASSADYILTMTARATSTMTVFNGNDVIKIWDRVLADYSVRHPTLSVLVNQSLETASSEHSYLFPSFSSIVDREKLIRVTTYESLLSSGPLPSVNSSEASNVLEHPLSYTRNAGGYFKTGPGVFPAIATAEFTRDSFFKRWGRDAVPSGLDCESLALWTDVMALSAGLLCDSITGSTQIFLLSGQSQTVSAKVLQTVSTNCQMSFNEIHVSVDAVADIMFESFLLDNAVLIGIKNYLYTQQSAADSRFLFNDDKALIPQKDASLLLRLRLKYSSFEMSQLQIPVAERAKSVWALFISDSFASEVGNWTDLLETLELRSESLCQRLGGLSPLLDPRVHLEMREIVCEFLNRQRMAVLCSSTSTTLRFLQTVENIPRLCSSVHSVHLYDNYTNCSGTEALARIVGVDGARRIQKLVDHHAAKLQKRLLASYLPNLSTLICSGAYKNAAVEAIVAHYERTKMTDTLQYKQWRARFDAAGKTMFNAHKQIDLTWEEVLESSKKVVCGTKTPSETEDISDEESSSGDFVGYLFDTNALGNAVYNIIYCRFLSVFLREHGAPVKAVVKDEQHNEMALLAKDITGAGLPLSFCTAGLNSLVPLATVIALNAEKEAGQTNRIDDLQFEKMRGLLILAAALPEVSSVKHFLTSIAMTMLMDKSSMTFVDQTTTGFFLLNELLGLEMVADKKRTEVASSESDGVHFTLDLSCFAASNSRVAVDHSHRARATSSDIEDIEVAPPAAEDRFTSLSCDHCVLIVGAHSQLLSELQVLLLLKQNLLYHCFPMMSKVWHTIYTMSTQCVTSVDCLSHDVFVLSFEVERFNLQWNEATSRIHRAMRVLSTIMTCLRHSRTIDGRLLIATWQSFSTLFTGMLTEQHQVAIEGELSSAIYQWLQQLKTILLPSDWSATMIQTLIGLFVDGTTPQGMTSTHKILSQLVVTRGEGIGIVPLEKKKDEDGDDDSAKKHAADDDDEEEEEDEQLEDFRLTDTTRLTLKQTLLAVSQCLASSYTGNSLVNTYSLNLSSAATNSIVVSSIERNLVDWADWTCDVYAVDMPGTGNYRMNWLDKLCVAFILKPSAVSGLLLAAIADLGLNLPFQTGLTEYDPQDLCRLAAQQDNKVLTVYNPQGKLTSIPPLETSLTARVFVAPDCFASSTSKASSCYFSLNDLMSFVREPSIQGATIPVRPPMNKQDSFTRSFRNVHLTVDASSDDKIIGNGIVHAVVVNPNTRCQWSGDLNVTSLLNETATKDAMVLETSRQSVCCFTTTTIEAVTLKSESVNEKEATTRLDNVFTTVYRLPVSVECPVFDDYRMLLEHVFHSVATCPILCTDTHKDIVLRIRWVLLMFHASVIYRLRNISCAVGIDTLLFAYQIVDTLYGGVSHDATGPAGHSHMAAVSASATPSSTYRPSSSTSAASDSMHYESVDVSKSYELLVFYVGECLYCSMVSGSHKLYGAIRSIFLSFFTPSSCDPEVEYYIQGKVAIPVDFDVVTAKHFFKLVNQLVLQSECNYVDLLGTTMSEVNATALSHLYNGVDSILCRLSDHTCIKYLRHQSKFLSSTSPTDQLSIVAEYDSMEKIKGILRSVLSLLPERIKTDSKEIIEKMADHKLGNNDKNKQQESKRRQAKKSAASRVQHTREFDPLWAFALSECFEYNRTVESLRTQINELLECQFSVTRYLLDKGVCLGESSKTLLESVSEVLISLENGRVPTSWSRSRHGVGGEEEESLPMRIEDWFALLSERRYMLYNWLTQGHAGILRLHLLCDPQGLLHALKETFALRHETTVDKTFFQYALLDPSTVSNTTASQANRENQGCNITIAGVFMNNALYSHRNCALEFLSEFSASSFGQKLVLQISASHDEYEVDDEEYLCPLYVTSDFPSQVEVLPLVDMHTSSVKPRVPVTFIPIATTEDTEDCMMFGISLYCCSK